MTNVYGNSRDILTLDDELNQSFYETENEEFNFNQPTIDNQNQKVFNDLVFFLLKFVFVNL